VDKPVNSVDKSQAHEVLGKLEASYPEAHCALQHDNPLQLLVATILSAQCTDARVNQVTPKLFARYPDAASLAAADPDELEGLIRPTGFYRNKARNIKAMAEVLMGAHDGVVPCAMDELVALPGVGRKTANVVLGNAYRIPGMVVDTHVKRVAFRLGWTDRKDPEKIENDLCRLLPREKWSQASHVLIFHGRRICKAPAPNCSQCPVEQECPRNGVTRSR